MKKFIVEVEEPKEGQIPSSGGIRNKDGRLETQYKNPIPYEEPPVVYKDLVTEPSQNNYVKSALKKFVGDVGSDIAYILWREVGAPFVEMKLRVIGQRVISKIESKAHEDDYIEADMITVNDNAVDQSEDISIHESDDNIIPFPKKKVV